MKNDFVIKDGTAVDGDDVRDRVDVVPGSMLAPKSR